MTVDVALPLALATGVEPLRTVSDQAAGRLTPKEYDPVARAPGTGWVTVIRGATSVGAESTVPQPVLVVVPAPTLTPSTQTVCVPPDRRSGMV